MIMRQKLFDTLEPFRRSDVVKTLLSDVSGQLPFRDQQWKDFLLERDRALRWNEIKARFAKCQDAGFHVTERPAGVLFIHRHKSCIVHIDVVLYGCVAAPVIVYDDQAFRAPVLATLVDRWIVDRKIGIAVHQHKVIAHPTPSAPLYS